MRVVRKVCVKNGGDWDGFTRLGTMKVQVIRLVSARQFRLVIIFSSNSNPKHKLMPRRFQIPWINPTARLRIECRRTIRIEHWPVVTARYLGWHGADVEVITGNIATIALDCGWFPQGAVNVSHRGCRGPYRIPNGKNTSRHSEATHVGGELEGVGRGGEASGGEEEGGDLHGWRYDLEKMRERKFQ